MDLQSLDLQSLSKHQVLALIGRWVVWQAIIIFGGMAVLRLTPGPVAAAIAAMLAYVAAVGIAMYLVEKRWRPRG